jgi:serine/threonine protein kinase
MAAVLTAGEILDGRYQIASLLASGGMGEVYRARRVLLGDEVAIKVIRMRGGDRADGLRESFLRESQLCAQLRHPNIVTILDFAIAPDGQPYLVMEHLNGPSLRDELASRGTFAAAEVQRIVTPLCGALQMAHERQIVHRDLKPGNIVSHRFESGDVVYKIIDFGLANIRDASEASDEGGSSADGFAGTVTYSSPEQLQALPLDARTDVYSLGAVVFEMLTGHPPYEASSPMGVMTKHLCDPVPTPSALAPHVPAWMDALVEKALAKEPSDRWASMAELAAALAGPAAEEGSAHTSELHAKYEVGPVIATGRLGSEVHSGIHRALGVPVAIRMLPRGPGLDWDAVRLRFLREARSLQVSHPSVIQVRDFGEDGDTLYVVTDLIPGRSLLEVLDAEAPLDWERVSALGVQLIEATMALHRRQALVCGLNPGIIRMTTDDDGERLMISTGGIGAVQDLLATQDGKGGPPGHLGTTEIPYLAPEVLSGQAADVRSDMFTVGAILYEMATGILPFGGNSIDQVLKAMLEASPRPPRDLQPLLPEQAAEALLACLACSPGARTATAADLRRQWRAIRA